MRISDWSSDVCSSVLLAVAAEAVGFVAGAGVCVAQVHGHGEGVAEGFELLADLVDEPVAAEFGAGDAHQQVAAVRSEEHTSELQSLMRISYAVFCLKKKKK